MDLGSLNKSLSTGREENKNCRDLQITSSAQSFYHFIDSLFSDLKKILTVASLRDKRNLVCQWFVHCITLQINKLIFHNPTSPF